jgi:hypothetical protein
VIAWANKRIQRTRLRRAADTQRSVAARGVVVSDTKMNMRIEAFLAKESTRAHIQY